MGSKGDGEQGRYQASEILNVDFSSPHPLTPSSPHPLTPSSPHPLTGLHVLLVDDDLDMLNLTALVLQAAGAIVQTADSAASALNHWQEFQPDVLLSDIAMPGEDGYQLLQQIRTLDPEKQVPAIALTAYAGQAQREASLRAGFQQHLTKPVEPEELVRMVLGVAEWADDSPP